MEKADKEDFTRLDVEGKILDSYIVWLFSTCLVNLLYRNNHFYEF